MLLETIFNIISFRFIPSKLISLKLTNVAKAYSIKLSLSIISTSPNISLVIFQYGKFLFLNNANNFILFWKLRKGGIFFFITFLYMYIFIHIDTSPLKMHATRPKKFFTKSLYNWYKTDLYIKNIFLTYVKESIHFYYSSVLRIVPLVLKQINVLKFLTRICRCKNSLLRVWHLLAGTQRPIIRIGR